MKNIHTCSFYIFIQHRVCTHLIPFWQLFIILGLLEDRDSSQFHLGPSLGLMTWSLVQIPSLKLTALRSHLKIGLCNPKRKRKSSIPTMHFQVILLVVSGMVPLIKPLWKKKYPDAIRMIPRFQSFTPFHLWWKYRWMALAPVEVPVQPNGKP